MAASTSLATNVAGGMAGGNQKPGGGSGWGGIGKVMEAIQAAKAAQQANAAEASGARVKTNMAAQKMAGGNVPMHGEEAHTGGAGPVGRPAPALFYKMKASGAKYNNSPINKNFGDAEARGFTPPTKMSTFGVGSKEKQGGVGSEMEPPLKLMGLVKKKVNKELESPAGQMFAKAAMGGV